MSFPQPIPSRPSPHHGREHWGAGAALDAALLSCSYLSASPIAQEILARDLAELHEDEQCQADADDGSSLDLDPEPLDLYGFGHGHGHGQHNGPDAAADNAAQPPRGVTYGSLRPSTIAGEILGGIGSPLLTARDLTLPRNAERSLLRDNHILPPKHARPAHESRWTRLYRRLFSTKVPAPQTYLDPHQQQLDAGWDDHMGSLSRASSKARPLVAASEVSPLLQHDYLSVSIGGAAVPGASTPPEEIMQDTWEAAVAAHAIRTTWKREAMTLLQYSRALIVTFLLHYSVQITSVFTVGRIGMLELGAVSLATMTANITCYAPVQGLSTCLDTLCAQAFGSGHKQLVGLQLQRMTYLLWLLLVPIALLWWNAARVLGLFIPEPETAALAGLYLRILILGTPGVAAFETGKRFVQAQGLFHATTAVLLIGAPLNVLANYVMVWKLGWGFGGAAAAVVITQNLLPLLLFVYVRFGQGMECWGGFTAKALGNWGPMVRLALPGMIMVEAQYFAFEVLTLATSRFGSAHLAAQSILVTITSTTYQIPFPLAIAASTRVANLIGAKLSDAARTSAKVAIIAGVTVGLFNMSALSAFRYKLPYLFTNDDRVAELVAQAMPVCAVMQIFDALAAQSHGLLRGIGRQAIGGFTNLSAYYLIALPISFATGFMLDWKLMGLWFGVTIGLGTAMAMEFVYLYSTSWEKAVEEAESRLRSDGIGAAELTK